MSPDTDHLLNAQDNARQYYGQELSVTADLKTSACCTVDSLPDYVREVLPDIHDEVLSKYYGCGTAFPADIQGLTVLDVGCGSGRDTYVMAKLVGEQGLIHGIDMTAEQIEVADRHRAHQAQVFGHAESNVRFVQDTIEHLDRHFEPDSLDLVTSNCVMNLLADKEPVLKQIHGLLGEGGEFYFSDVYVDRRLPADVRNHRVLHGECLGGALYGGDFLRLARRVGFADPRLVTNRVIEIDEPELRGLVGNAVFRSMTYRLWKLDGLEDVCEDFGHVATYKGGHPQGEHRFTLDEEHVFEQGLPERVCGNTALMLAGTRLARFFEVSGDFSTHHGRFVGCGTSVFNRGDGDAGCGC